LANYLRLRALYPAKNHRVCTARDALLEWTRRTAIGNRTVCIRVSRDRAEVGEIPVEVATPNLRWLAEQMLRVAVGGFDLTAAVDADTLDRLALQIQRCAAGSSTPLLDSWPSDLTQIRPIPLVFVGTHCEHPGERSERDGARAAEPDLRSELARRIHSSPRLRSRLESLQSRLNDRMVIGEARRELPILDHILELAQSDAGFADKDPIEVVDEALAAIDREIVTRMHGLENSPQSALADTALRVAHRFFSQKTAALATAADDSAVTERPADRAVHDDLDGLIADLLTLPWESASPNFDDDARLRAHHLGILAELIEAPLVPSTPARAAAAIGKLMRAHVDLDLTRARELFVRADPSSAAPVATSGNPAVETLRAFDAAGAMDVVLERRVVAPEFFGAEFPHWFGEWIDSLIPGRPHDEDLFARTLSSIPAERFDEGFQHLFAREVLPGGDRLTRALALAGKRAGALLERLLRVRPNIVRGVALRWLFEASLPPIETAVIRLLPADRIPIQHIGRLCLLVDGDTRQRPRILEESAALLRRFAVEGVESVHHERRIRVIRALADFPSLQTLGALEDLASGWGIASMERRELRSVAKEALRVVRSKPCA
jgi:hypothetical protein